MLGSLDVVQSCCPSYLLPHSLLFSTVIYRIELAAHPKPCSSCLSSAEGAQSLSAVWLPLIEQLSTLQKPTDKPMSGCQHTLNLLSYLMWFQWRILEARDNSEYGNEQRLQWLEHDLFSVSTKPYINSSSNPVFAVCRPCSVPYYKTAKSKPTIRIYI